MAGYQSVPAGWLPPFQLLPTLEESPAWLYGQGPWHGGSGGPARGCPQPLSTCAFARQRRSPLEAMERLRLVLLELSPPGQEGHEGPRRATASQGCSGARQEGPLRRRRRLCLEVPGFSAEELSVRLEGRRLSVVGQKERRRGGQQLGQFLQLRREVLLPRDTDLKAVACSLGPGGRLWVELPRLALPSPDQTQEEEEEEEERHVPIPLTRTDDEAAAEQK